MSTAVRSANLLVAVIFMITAACTINVAGRVDLPLAVMLWVVGAFQIIVAVGPLRTAVAGTTKEGKR